MTTNNLFYPDSSGNPGNLIDVTVACPGCHRHVSIVKNHKVIKDEKCPFCDFPLMHGVFETSQV